MGIRLQTIRLSAHHLKCDLRQTRSISLRKNLAIKMSMTPEKIRGGGELFKFPWTAYSRVQMYNFRWRLRNWPHYKYLVRTCAMMAPIVLYIGIKLNTGAENAEKAAKLKESRKHTFFDLPH